ncbi:egg cell-secreted protein 1.1 [Juglans microcarpa x Juglans regia]|uniref:egg cell-secreted protein 1.1 n=1 Tax=Juglans microcarpa x Juglans regia TaxID=2249226 RepID=UPI001B7F46D7|nr:egg cell-secreted protein 1.1 [Juglans microcarpa x Juglans regia]
MAYTSFILFFLTVSLALSMASMAVMSRPLGTSTTSTTPSLRARLKLDDGDHDQSPVNCWDSLLEISTCSAELINFFFNLGDQESTYNLRPSCCQAIRVIGSQQCWPEMFGFLGFTTEEGDILQGYCDALAHMINPTTPSPPSVSPNKIMQTENLVP